MLLMIENPHRSPATSGKNRYPTQTLAIMGF
jgi:hypothetical protein